jgi:RNA polymerase-associated protein RTF1
MADEMDLENEMLSLAGRSGTASGKRSRKQRAAAGSDESDELFDLDSDDEYDADYDGGGGKQRGKASGSKRQAKRGRAAVEDEEEEEEGDGYGSDLYIDEEDRAKLAAMTELQREMILADRAEERDQLRQRRALLKQSKSVADKARDVWLVRLTCLSL